MLIVAVRAERHLFLHDYSDTFLKILYEFFVITRVQNIAGIIENF